MIELVRIAHHLSMAVFIGNITATLIWKMIAEKNSNPSSVSHTLQMAVLTDKVVTIPAVLAVTGSGIFLMVLKKISLLGEMWLLWSLILWLMSALVAAFYLVPSLSRLHMLAVEQQNQEQLDSIYYAKARRWNIASSLLILSPVIILVLMLVKP